MNLAEQRQHMLTGAMYDDLTPELVAAREKTVLLTNKYNATFGQTEVRRTEVLRELLHSIGEGGLF